jgi:hypothetical protein
VVVEEGRELAGQAHATATRFKQQPLAVAQEMHTAERWWGEAMTKTGRARSRAVVVWKMWVVGVVLLLERLYVCYTLA